MNISFWGHNGFLLWQKGTAVLIDPWISKNGAYFGSWFQWPLNHDKFADLIAEVAGKKLYIYISHEHQDHFDLETLKQLAAYCDRAVIPSYFDKFLNRELSKLGYKVTELADSEELSLGDGLRLKPMIVDTGVNHDSAVLISSEDEVFLNQNDCKILDRIKSIKEPITYYAVQFSGANWHPECYSYAPAQKFEISQKKINSKLIGLKNTINAIKPRFLLPSAGPAIFPFFDPALSLGENNIFIHQDELGRRLKNIDTEIVYLRPGDRFDTQSTTPILPPTEQVLATLAADLPNGWDELARELDPDRLLSAIRRRLEEIKGLTFEKCPQLLLRWGDGETDGVSIDLNTCDAQIGNAILDDDFYYCLTSEPKYFALMSDESVRWQDLALSFRARLDRKPDRFSSFINLFLYSDVSNIKKSFTTTLNISEERIVRLNERTGKSYEFHRYCPHNGADLIDAEIDDTGHIVCPRHAWRFNLENGGNCAENQATIAACEVEDTITLCETISARLVRTPEPVS